jgi:DNA polymerase V
MKPIYALIDCNNFFVSCERAFQPALQNVPVAVLSGNDGCVISRSQEVKKLGLAMGAPLFKEADFIREHGIKIFSSNFELYSDMSGRVMSLLKRFTDRMEVYSIDEAFLRLDDVPDPVTYARKIRKIIWKSVRIPVSIGLAPSKTLAKAASHWAKDNPESNGVFSFLDGDIRSFLQKIPIEEVWGIGRNLKVFMHGKQVYTADEFAYKNPAWIKNHMGVVGLKLAQELQGIPCDGHISDESKRSIMCTRSFGKTVTDINELRQALAMHAAHAGEKLREEGEVAGMIGVHLRTNRFNADKKYSATQFIQIETPTNYTPELSKQASRVLDLLYKPGYKYAKIGVLCIQLSPEDAVQQSMFEQRNGQKEHRAMEAYDHLNAKFGAGTVRYAQSGTKRPWSAKREMLSKAFTTNITELPVVKAS